MSQILNPSAGGGGGSGIQTINGDTGSITGSTVTIYADNAANNSGASVQFVNSGTVSTLDLTDADENTLIGTLAGNLTLSGSANTGLGRAALGSLTSGNSNVGLGVSALNFLKSGFANSALGVGAGQDLVSGSFNILLGDGSAGNYGAAESSNILIGNNGVANESNVMRLGTTGSGDQEVNKCFIAGISGVTTAEPSVVTLNTSTGQMSTILAGTIGNVLTDNGTNWVSAPASGGGISEFFTAYLSADTGNVTGDGTYYPIVCNSFLGASNANYNTTTGLYTAPTTSIYMITQTISVTGTLTTNLSFNTYWNGSTILFKSYDIPATPATSGNLVISASIVIPMTAGDTMGIAVDIDGSGIKNVLVDGGFPGGFLSTTMFSVTRLA